MHGLYPDAPIFTAVADPELVQRYLPDAEIHTSFLQRYPLVAKHHQKFLPLYMLAFEQFDLSEFDLVISSSHCAAKSIITKPDTCHICYCHSPMRYAWDMQHAYSKHQGRLTRSLWALASNYVRVWDASTASRVDYFIANSSYIARRIRKCYGREAAVIHPPVDVDRFHTAPEIGDYYLTVSRFAPYKRIDLIIAAFTRIGTRLMVIGDGEQEGHLRRISGPSIEFKGRVSDGDVVEFFARCKGSVHAAEEDFGINMVESLASGRPVVAYGVGGSADIIEPGLNGVLFRRPSVEGLVEALKECDSRQWDSQLVRQTSLRFSEPRFRQELASFVEWARVDFGGNGQRASLNGYPTSVREPLVRLHA